MDNPIGEGFGIAKTRSAGSIPELAVSASAAYQGSKDVTIAHVVGSNIFNITVILMRRLSSSTTLSAYGIYLGQLLAIPS